MQHAPGFFTFRLRSLRHTHSETYICIFGNQGVVTSFEMATLVIRTHSVNMYKENSSDIMVLKHLVDFHRLSLKEHKRKRKKDLFTTKSYGQLGSCDISLY